VVDYLQLMSGPPESAGNREQEVSTISRSLKAVAKELNIPIIALSQLNRSVELRSGDKRPQLSDLRESGAIEQDADLVIFIHRPERFGLLQDAEGNSTKGLAEIIIAKHRNGSVGDVQLKFKAEQAKFTDLEDDFISGIGDFDDGAVVLGSKMNSGGMEIPMKDDLQPNTDFEDAF
jgi:replicative DNA helicase